MLQAVSVQPSPELEHLTGSTSPARVVIDGTEISVDAIFDSLPARFDPRYRVVPGVCQFRITGADGGDYHTRCTADHLEVGRGVAASPGCTVVLPDADFVGWCVGRVRDHELLASGRLQITGDPELLFSLVMILQTGVPRETRDTIAAVEAALAGRPALGEVERITALTPAYLRDAARSKRPFLLVGATAGWGAASWSLDSLQRRFGHVPFPVRKISASSPWVSLFPLEVAGSSRGARGTMRLGDFIDLIRASSPDDPPVPHTDLMTLPDELAGEIGALSIFPPSALTGRLPELFMSARGAYTPVHRDLEDGASCVFVGPRRFRLWSPDQAPLLYAMPDFHPKFQGCFVDARRPDLARFPRFAEARAVEVTVEPGDALYVPFGWFHDVTVLDHGLTIRLDYHPDLHTHVV